MTEIKSACPAHQGSTRGSDSYAWNPVKKQGYCHSCQLSTWEDDEGHIWGRRSKAQKPFLIEDGGQVVEHEGWPSEPLESLANKQGKTEGMGSQVGEYVPMRGITKDTMEFYGVKVFPKVPWELYDHHTRKVTDRGVSDEIHATYPNGSVKIRRLDLPKDHPAHFTSKGSMDTLFGMNLFPIGCSKKITIVEGDHFDTLSAYQMLKGAYINPVVSLPGAKPSGKLWEKCKSYLDSFEEIILSVDNDQPGREVAELMFDLFPGKIYVMDHGKHKDASDFLQANDAAAYKSAWWKKKKYSPAGFTASLDDWMTALDEEDPYEYVPTPFAEFNKVGRGLVKGGITVIKAPPGSGKSSLLRCLQHHLTTKENCVNAALMMEEVKSITGRAMASYQLGKNVMTKEDAEWNGVSEEEVKEALKEVIGEERFVSFDINPQDPIEDTLRQCNHAIAVYGADYIWIDHLQRLAYLSGTDAATSNLTSLGVKLTELAKRKNVGIIAISHVNEEGHTKYAKSIEEEAIVLIELERDRFAEDMEERNTAYLTITKNRPFGSTGAAGALTYDAETTILSEKQGPKEPKVERQDF